MKSKFLKSVVFSTVSISLMWALMISSSASAAEVKIGYVNMQQAIQQTSSGKKAKKKLEKAAKSKENTLKQREKALKAKSADFKKKQSVYDAATKRKKQMQLQKEFYELQQMLGQSQNEIRKKEEKMLHPIIKGLQKEIQKIAKKENYTLVVEKAGNLVLFAKDEIDLTNRVVKAYEKNK